MRATRRHASRAGLAAVAILLQGCAPELELPEPRTAALFYMEPYQLCVMPPEPVSVSPVAALAACLPPGASAGAVVEAWVTPGGTTRKVLSAHEQRSSKAIEMTSP